MTKIKITEKEQELEGTLHKGKVTPFGTSAHIPFKKEHTGKVVNIVVPEDSKYIWLISKQEQEKLIKDIEFNVIKTNGKMEPYRLEALEDIKNPEFDLDSLIKLLDFISDKTLVTKIKQIYNL